MASGVDALLEGLTPEDPWLALLLGAISVAAGFRESVEGEGGAGASEGRSEPDEAQLALLGLVALERRLAGRLRAIEALGAEERAQRVEARRGLLR